MTAPIRYSPVRIAPLINQPSTENPIQDYCDKLDVTAKYIITALTLGFTFYCGRNFYERFIITDITPSAMYGIGFIGGMLVTAYMISEVSSIMQQEEAQDQFQV